MEQQLRFGIVGTGMIANVMAKAITESATAELAAVSSRRLDTAKEFANKYGSVEAFDSWQKMFDWSGIDAVYVAVPTAYEEEICLAAAGAGKHVLAEKPFINLQSLQSIIATCRDNNVVFMDATHFVHHPRTKHIHDRLTETIGTTQAIRTGFFFPFTDRTNIRYNPEIEPIGALGDMAWYSIRAVVEFSSTNGHPNQIETFIQRDDKTNAIIRASGLLTFENGVTSTWDIGYNAGVCMMDLDILGTDGAICLDDFVLDWAKGFAFDNPNHNVGYTVRKGMAAPNEFQFIPTPSDKTQQAVMIEDFVFLAQNRDRSDLYQTSIDRSERTQYLLDAIQEKATQLKT